MSAEISATSLEKIGGDIESCDKDKYPGKKRIAHKQIL